MTNEVKDTAATVTTIVGGGAFVMGINEILTLALLVTGIVLNIIRNGDDQSNILLPHLGLGLVKCVRTN